MFPYIIFPCIGLISNIYKKKKIPYLLEPICSPIQVYVFQLGNGKSHLWNDCNSYILNRTSSLDIGRI